MKINTNYLQINYLIDDIHRGIYQIPSYQREYCWNSDKIDLFIDSLDKKIPIGVFQFRKRYDGYKQQIDVIDGLHRIKTLLKILTGDGIYYNFDTKSFTQLDTDFDYSKFIDKTKISPFSVILFDRNDCKPHDLDYERTIIFHESFEKVYRTDLIYFEYEGTDEEIEIAFDRINQDGVTFTPIFNKVSESSVLTF
jgi:uncharacterized protein with ParB-like and HNH nuclease domain